MKLAEQVKSSQDKKKKRIYGNGKVPKCNSANECVYNGRSKEGEKDVC